MITIKKICILVILISFHLVLASTPLAALNFSVSPFTGILYGKSEEIVYKNPNSDLYLSELLWDLKPLFYIGLAGDLSLHDIFTRHGFTSAFSVKAGLPFKTGIHENRDWMNYSNNYLTHYSRHDAFSRGTVLADISAGFSWRLNNYLALKVYGEFSYMRLSWSGRDGYIQYPSFSASIPEWNDNLPKQGISGEVIQYTQNWFILAPGLSLSCNPPGLFSFAGVFCYSPLTYCNAKDRHIITNTTYIDKVYLGHYVKISAEAVFMPLKNLDLSLKTSYSQIKGARGDSSNGFITSKKGAGAGYSAFDLGLSARIRLSAVR